MQVLGSRAASVTTCSAVLHGYARIMVPSFDYPFVVPADASSRVDGELLIGIQAADYDILDRYEDVEDGLYVRIMVTVVRQTGPADAWVYLRGPNAPA
jgi:hypothetical protein